MTVKNIRSDEYLNQIAPKEHYILSFSSYKDKLAGEHPVILEREPRPARLAGMPDSWNVLFHSKNGFLKSIELLEDLDPILPGRSAGRVKTQWTRDLAEAMAVAVSSRHDILRPYAGLNNLSLLGTRSFLRTELVDDYPAIAAVEELENRQKVTVAGNV